MAALIPGVENVNWMPIVSQAIYWVGIILLAVLIIGAFIAIYYFMSFRMSAMVIPLYGSGRDGVFSFGKPKKNRVKWVKQRTAWRSLWPLGNKIEREPFDSEYIYPGDKLYIFELNQQWIPGRININKTEQDLRAEINPVPYYIRNWQSLTHKKNAQEFAKMGFWEENKYLFITLGVVLFNLILCGAVIYFTYKFAAGGRADIQSLTQAIKSFGNIPSSGVIPK